jgi:two-component system, chemotaxis family, response regulator PixG
MITHATAMPSGILDQLKFCRDKRFTGKLCAINLNGDSVDTLEGHCWNIYFYRGRLTGDSAGVHPLRRLRRQFSEQRIDLPEQIEHNVLNSLSINNLSFCAIGDLLANRYLDRDQAEGILMGSLIEVIFDILHYETIAHLANKPQLSYILESDLLQESNVPAVLMKPETIVENAIAQFKSWQSSGLIKYSPHLSPQIEDLDLLQDVVPVRTYQKIILLLEDDRTLRDIAIKIDEDIKILTKSLLGLCKKNVLVLRRTSDIELIEKSLSTEIKEAGVSDFFIDSSLTSALFSRKLVAHISQNTSESSAIQNVMEKAGHEYLNLKESTEALLAFLKCSPDLILLDGSSSGFNTQDFCERLRRTGKFKTTPIVVLSKSDSILDRLRSNSVDYVSKPLSQQKIFSIMNKYIVQQVS